MFVIPSDFASEALGFEVLYFHYPRLAVTNFAAGDDRPVRKRGLKQTLRVLAGISRSISRYDRPVRGRESSNRQTLHVQHSRPSNLGGHIVRYAALSY